MVSLSNESIELYTNCTYTVNITTTNQHSSIIIDTLIVAADWSELAYIGQSKSEFGHRQCYDWINERYESGDCEELVLSSMAEVYQHMKG
mgnify:FL=1